jgi:hypothetical protein
MLFTILYVHVLILNHSIYCVISSGGRRGRDRIVNGFTTTYAISVYHH